MTDRDTAAADPAVSTDDVSADPGGRVSDEPAPDQDDATAPVSETRRPLSRAETRWFVGIVALAAVLRLAWWVAFRDGPPAGGVLGGDPYAYWYYANDISHGRWYIHYVTGEPTAFYPVGFPALLGGLYWIFGNLPFVDIGNWTITGVFHIVISTATVALTFVVGRRLGGPRVGLVAAAVMAVFPNLIFQVTSVQIETTFIFLTMASLAVIVDHDWSTGPPGWRRLVAFGLVLAACGLVRPFSLPILLGVYLAVLAVGAGWRRAVAVVAVPVAVIVVAFIPWTVRNWIELDGFVPSSTNMGDTLCLDRYEGATARFTFPNHEGCVDPDTPEAERNPANTRKALRWVIENPDQEVRQIFERAFYMFRDDNDGLDATEGLTVDPVFSDSTRDTLAKLADLYFLAVLALSVAGLFFLRGTPRPERRIVVTVGATLLVVPLLLWGNPRFHQPVVPFMAVSVGLLVSAIVDALAARRASGADVATGPSAGDPAVPTLAGASHDGG